jgi:hypothetical protein
VCSAAAAAIGRVATHLCLARQRWRRRDLQTIMVANAYLACWAFPLLTMEAEVEILSDNEFKNILCHNLLIIAMGLY